MIHTVALDVTSALIDYGTRFREAFLSLVLSRSRPRQARFILMLSYRDTPQKCHFTLGFCMLIFSIPGCPRGIPGIMHTSVTCMYQPDTSVSYQQNGCR
jgi:hypothetical protein